MAFDTQPAAPSRTVLRRFAAFCRPHLQRGVRRTDADRYVKRYDSVGFAVAWVAYFVHRLTSLRGLREFLADATGLQRIVGWGDISVAHISRLQHTRPPELWEPLVSHLIGRLQGRAVPSRIRLLDTSFFRLSSQLLKRRCPHKRMGPGTAGAKIGVVLDPDNWLPVRLCHRVGQDCDTGWLDDLVAPGEDVRGLLFIFDRGFRKYSFFERLIADGADFLTRATAQIRYTVKATRPLDPAQPQVVKDERVILGSANGRNLMTRPVRRIELSTEVRRDRKHTVQRLVFLTSDLHTEAWELCELYRRRWEIETFFRWFKRTIGCQRPLGHSAEAAAHTFWAALVTYLLVLAIHQALGRAAGLEGQRGQSAVGLQRTLHRLHAALAYGLPEDLLRALQSL